MSDGFVAMVGGGNKNRGSLQTQKISFSFLSCLKSRVPRQHCTLAGRHSRETLLQPSLAQQHAQAARRRIGKYVRGAEKLERARFCADRAARRVAAHVLPQ